ncbi:hypothetical protein OAA60_05530 [Porticoccaceae bacterium]|nr:hypothetical protein [Porticoccaceae bacterium]
MEIKKTTKAEAKEKGLKRYFVGKPCKRGHVSERYVADGACCECKIDCAKAYREEYRDSIKKQVKVYRYKNKDKMAIADRHRLTFRFTSDQVAQYKTDPSKYLDIIRNMLDSDINNTVVE